MSGERGTLYCMLKHNRKKEKQTKYKVSNNSQLHQETQLFKALDKTD